MNETTDPSTSNVGDSALKSYLPNRVLTFWLIMASVMFLALTSEAQAQNYPPAVEYNSTFLYPGGNGNYSFGWWGDYTATATWDAGYESWGYDDNGNYVDMGWVSNLQTNTYTSWGYYWVDVQISGSSGNNVSFVYSQPDGSTINYTGSYDFTIGVFSGDPGGLVAVNTDGSAWTPPPPPPTAPSFGPPTVWVNGTVYAWQNTTFNDSSQATGVDIYVDGYGDSWYVEQDAGGQSVASSYGQPQGLSMVTGYYFNGVFELGGAADVRAADTSGNPITATAVDGTPPALWVDGMLWAYLGASPVDANGSGASFYEYGGGIGQRVIIDGSSSALFSYFDSSITGLWSQGCVWTCQESAHDMRAAQINGNLLTPGCSPNLGPAVLVVNSALWRYAGTWNSSTMSWPVTGTAPANGDYYLGKNIGQRLLLDPSGNVTVWNSGGTVSTGQYAGSTFTVTGVSIEILGDNDTVPTTAPLVGPPAIWVNGVTFTYSGTTANETANLAVDNYTDAANTSNQVLVRSDGAWGYNADQSLAWSGVYLSYVNGGVFAVNAGSSGHYDVRASTGSSLLQTGGSPQEGHPAAVKVNNCFWNFAGSVGTDSNTLDYYYGSLQGQRLVLDALGGTELWTGTQTETPTAVGRLDGSVFFVNGFDLRACASGNLPVAPSGSLQDGPAAVWVEGIVWNRLGSVSDTQNLNGDYYGGPNPNQIIRVGTDGNVSGFYTGSYSGGASGVFLVNNNADLRAALDATGTLSTPTPPTGVPDTLRIGGLHWEYLGSVGGVEYYASTQAGQRLSIDANGGVTYGDRPDGISGATGTYANGTYTSLTGGVAFSAGTINGDLDILGNILSMGSLADNKNTAGLTISFVDNNDPVAGYQSTVMFAGSRQATNWIWARAAGTSGSTSVTMMSVDSANRLTIYDPSDPSLHPMVFDPAGVKSYIPRQGDLDMGEFTSSPQP